MWAGTSSSRSARCNPYSYLHCGVSALTRTNTGAVVLTGASSHGRSLMDHASASIALIKEQQVFLASRRRILNGAVVAAAAIAVGGLRNPLTALANDNTECGVEHETLMILLFSLLAGIQNPFLGDDGLSAFRVVHGGG